MPKVSAAPLQINSSILPITDLWNQAALLLASSNGDENVLADPKFRKLNELLGQRRKVADDFPRTTEEWNRMALSTVESI